MISEWRMFLRRLLLGRDGYGCGACIPKVLLGLLDGSKVEVVVLLVLGNELGRFGVVGNGVLAGRAFGFRNGCSGEVRLNVSAAVSSVLIET